MDRIGGYYWVKFQGEWVIATYHSKFDFWLYNGLKETAAFDEINENRIKSPDENTKRT
jgi:hypothetical protein